MKYDNYQMLTAMAKSLMEANKENGNDGAPFIVAVKPEMGSTKNSVAVCANGSDLLSLTAVVLESTVKTLKGEEIPYQIAETVVMKMAIGALENVYGEENLKKSAEEKSKSIAGLASLVNLLNNMDDDKGEDEE